MSFALAAETGGQRGYLLECEKVVIADAPRMVLEVGGNEVYRLLEPLVGGALDAGAFLDVVGELALGDAAAGLDVVELGLPSLRHLREGVDCLAGEVAGVRLARPFGREGALYLLCHALLALDGLAADLPSCLPFDDLRLDVLGATPPVGIVALPEPLDLDTECASRRRSLAHREGSHEVVGGVEESDGLLVADLLDDAAGHLLVGGIGLRQKRESRLSPVSGDHLPGAVGHLPDERDVREAVLGD